MSLSSSSVRRAINARTIAIAAVAAIALLSVRAQSQVAPQREIDRSLSWCAAPASKPEWARQTIYLTLDEEGETKVPGAKPLPPSHMAALLQAVQEKFRSTPEASGLFSENGKTLLPADSRYRVQSIIGDLLFQLRGDGTIDSLVIRGVRDSTFYKSLAFALRAAASPGALIPFGASSDIRQMRLKPLLNPGKTDATWRMFTMEVPRERPVTIVKRPSISFPPGTQNWKANITLQFYVDTAGKAEPRTIVSVPSPDSIAFPDAESRDAYFQFVTTAFRGVERTQFKPAEFMGCRYRRLISQPLIFKPGSLH